MSEKGRTQVWWAYFEIALVLFFGGRAVFRLLAGEDEVGSLGWWWDLAIVLLLAGLLLKSFKTLVRHRNERAAG